MNCQGDYASHQEDVEGMRLRKDDVLISKIGSYRLKTTENYVDETKNRTKNNSPDDQKISLSPEIMLLLVAFASSNLREKNWSTCFQEWVRVSHSK